MDTSRFDYTFEETEKLEKLKRLILSNFETRGYRQIHLSAFETTKTFVEQQGETVRQKIFTLNGDAESELCLRPELTVPAFKFFQENLSGKTEHCRMCYEGLVWRMDSNQPGFFSEFTQAGVELVGSYCEIGADTELLDLAIETLVNCGIEIEEVVVNDIRILKSVFKELGVGEKLQSLVERTLVRGGVMEDLPVSQDQPDEQGGVFEDVLGQVGPEKLSAFLVEILSLQGFSQGANSRTPEDVARRFIRKKSGDKNSFSQHQMEVLLELLSISGEVEDVAIQLQTFARKNKFSEIEKYIEMLPQKTKLLKAALPDNVSPSIRWKLGFQRSFKYYSGLIFDINSKNGAVCGGGRYDDLFSQIGVQEKSIKAAGFAIGVDRLLGECADQSDAPREKPKAIVAPLGDAPVDQCFAIARDVRCLNWIVETDFSGSNVQNIIKKAVRAEADILLLLGNDEIEAGTVTVKQLAAKTQETIPVSELAEFLARFSESGKGGV